MNPSVNRFCIYTLRVTSVIALIFVQGCVEEPVKEDIPELVTRTTLTFTPVSGGNALVVSASDPDGEGVQDIVPDGAILLEQGKTYALSLRLVNELADPTSPEYDITNEVREEGNEHLFFFAWTNNVFSVPTGNGNIDNRNDAVGYGDADVAGLPIGLTTTWTTATTPLSGTFRIVLKHQPNLKSTTSGSADGETDLDLTFDIEVH